MADYGISRNGEGYSDPTAAEAIKGMAKPGEIWRYKGHIVLIVKNQGVYSNILTISKDQDVGNDWIEVVGRHVEGYTTPGKLSYAFNSNLTARIDRLSDEDFKCVLNEIQADLGFSTAKEIITEDSNEAKAANAVNSDLEDENKALKKKVSLLRSMYDDLLNKFVENFGRA